MPVQGLNKNLDVILSTLILNGLKGWQIYEEKSGNVVVKIRFNGEHDTVDEITTGTYKRKSEAQVNRDFKRSKDHNSTKMKTRSQVSKDSEIEFPRFDNSHSHDIQCTSAFTPESVQSSHSQLDPHAPPFLINTPPNHNDNSPEVSHSPVTGHKNSSMLPVDVSPATHVPLPAPLLEDHAVDSTIQSDDESIASDVTDPETPRGCLESNCAYGGQLSTGVDIYKCEKCGCDVCVTCKEFGSHKGHRKYMRLQNGDEGD